MDNTTTVKPSPFVPVMLIVGLLVIALLLYNLLHRPPNNPPYPKEEIAKRDSIIAADRVKIAELQDQKDHIQKMSDSLLHLNAGQETEISRLIHSNGVLQREKGDIAGRINRLSFGADSVLQEYLNFK